jgi:acetyl esterase
VTIDPELAVVVDLANSVPRVDPRATSVDELRATARRAALAYGPGPDLRAVEDRAVASPTGPIPVRLYTPHVDPVGLLVFFHGSGFVIYDLDTHDRECRLLADAAGVVVVSVDYRLAPEHPFPAAFDDCLAATRWAAANAEQIGVTGGRIAVGGDSAGGNLAAAVSAVLRDAGDVDIAFQMLVYPVTDLDGRAASYVENGSGYLLSAEMMEFFIESYTPDAGDRRDHRASPLLADDFGGLPRTLVITAGFDPLRDEGEAYAEALDQAGVDVTLIRYDGAIHGFFQMSQFSALAKQAIDDCVAHLADALGPERPRNNAIDLIGTRPRRGEAADDADDRKPATHEHG